ncbi:hypothetical protein L7F22_008619 [Adiantum nelumboides]|nr:hypothetical protein [Adiantum nelumboides]
MTAPIWLFISVNPHMFDAVLSCLNGESVLVTASAPRGRRDRDRCRSRRTGSWRGRGSPRTSAAWSPTGTTSAASSGRPPAPADVGPQPAAHELPVVVGELAVLGERREAGDRPAQVALGVVVLAGTHDGRGDEVAVAGGGLHDQVRPEQLADQRLEDAVGREDGLAPVVLDRGEGLGELAGALPLRRVVPRVEVGGAVEAVDLLGQRQVVEREVLGEPDLAGGVRRERRVVHVGRSGALVGREDVEAEDVLDVHPGADVALDEAHPVGGPVLERLRVAGVLDVLGDLPDDVRVVAEEGELPLLVGVAELVPPVGRPVLDGLAAGADAALRLGVVDAPGLELGPVQRVAGLAVGEAVDPALREVVPRVRLDLDGDVLVVGLLALGGLVVVVAPRARARVGELPRPASASVKTGLGTLRCEPDDVSCVRRDRRVDHRRGTADVGIRSLQIGFVPPDHLRDQAGLAGPVPAVAVGQGGDVPEAVELGRQFGDLLLEAEIGRGARAVVEGGPSFDAALGHRPQQAQYRRHAGATADEDDRRAAVLAEGEGAEGRLDVEPVTGSGLLVEPGPEQPTRVDLDDELVGAVPVGGVGHGERTALLGPGADEVHVLPGEELDLRRLDQLDGQVPHVVGDGLDRHDLDHALGEGQAGPDDLLVVVEQLDRQVLVGVRPAEEGRTLLLLVVGQGERRVGVVLDVLALEHEGLAGRALALLAAVHELDALLGRGAKDVLVLVDLDLDADGLEPNDVFVAHECRPPLLA